MDINMNKTICGLRELLEERCWKSTKATTGDSMLHKGPLVAHWWQVGEVNEDLQVRGELKQGFT